MLPKEWCVATLGTIVDSLDSGVSVNGEDRKMAAGEVGVLKISAVTYGIFQPSEHKAVNKDEVDRVRVNPRAGRILISRSNTIDLVGASVYIYEDHPRLFLSDILWQLEPKIETHIHTPWLAQWLGSDKTRSSISRLATGTSGSMKKISKKSFLAMSIQLPPPIEQRRIADALSTWDKAIATIKHLLVNSRKQRAAMLSQILPGKRRLRSFKNVGQRSTPHGAIPSDWLYPKIDELASEISKKHVGGESFPVLSCTKHAGLVNSLSYFKKQVFSKDLSTYKVVPRGAFAYATNHIEEGSIGYQNLYDFGLVSPMYTVFKTTDQVHDDYLYRLLKTEHFRQIFEAATNSSVDRRGSLRWNEFKKLHVPLPSIKEQQAIAHVLMQADKEIALLEQQLRGLQQEKSALMQQLLTGKRRVRLPTEAKALPA